MEKILVTDGAGFIGSNFLRHLLNNTNCAVINLDELTYAGNLSNIEDLRRQKRHKLVRGDIRNRRLVESLVKKADAAVNFAVESHVDRRESSFLTVPATISGARSSVVRSNA